MALGDKERAQELIEKNSSETVKYYEENTRQIHLAANKKDGESVAFLEVPKYIPEEIEKAIALSGYRANDLKPTKEAYESLDYCCKKK